MRTGLFTSRVELMSPSTNVGGSGQRSTSFSSQGLRWGHADIAVSEATEASGAEQLETVTFTFMYDPAIGLDKGWRIVWNNNNYEVLTVAKDDTQRELITAIAKFAR